MWKSILPLLLALGLTSCATISPETRRHHADTLASAEGWQRLTLPTQHFVLAAYAPAAIRSDKILTVYIEGDGMAWLTRSQPSDDPTPRQPVSLELALRHTRGNAAYLARPCQYVAGADRRGCDEPYWTARRFAPEVIDASNEAIDALKRRFDAQQLVLAGYSGGGAVAALVAARRSDVVRLVTVAGNLDHAAWTRLHRVLPLEGSLNAADAWQSLQDIPQLHFVGGKDATIPPGMTASYLSRFPVARRPEMRVVEDFSHVCCWAGQWPALSSQAFP
ncbi:alpha/beta hydrolase [Noviherbaspirillum cavernae]|uniref:Alpha/beta hydrolase n=1 Tax=Noviherbaspirillum cavernae TaxID=2320862 RepID=A0A418WY72_9BURK|nr:alpha/beta hydrolase [Noviherbaspirillum cavernae]RJG05180.1 alpha/beta hydrolase [Noviherbaspirillum cavernae]